MKSYNTNISIWKYLIPGSWKNNRRTRKFGLLYIENAEIALNKAFKEMDIPFETEQNINSKTTANTYREYAHLKINYNNNSFLKPIEYKVKVNILAHNRIRVERRFDMYENKIQRAIELADRKYFTDKE